MHATPTPKLLPGSRSELFVPSALTAEAEGSPSLLGVLWRRRGILLLTPCVFVVAAVLYLIYATRVYSSTAQVSVEQDAGKVFSDHTDIASHSDDFLYTQAEFVRSAPVLNRALSDLHYRDLKTFARVSGDPIDWMKNAGDFSVEVGKKGEVLTVSMESPYADEAAQIVNSVVAAYIFEQAHQRQATGVATVKILREEQAGLVHDRDGLLLKIEQLKKTSGVLSFKDDKQNTDLAHLEALSTSLNATQLASLELRSQVESAKAIAARPEAISAYVQAQQTKEKDAGDKEYDELRSQMSQLNLSLTATATTAGSRNPRIQALTADVAMLKQRIAAKEASIFQAHLQDLNSQLEASESKERQLRTAMEAERTAAIAQSPHATEYATLQANADQLQKQCDQIDARISEVSANSAALLNVQIVDPARVGSKPVKPKQPLTLIAAMLAGLLVGTGLCLVRESQDTRFHQPEEIANSLGVPLIGVIPRIPSQLSMTERGQLVHRDPMSPAAEAFRTLRTAVHFGPVPEAKTILVVSPMPGDGKSTTASNLSIALAEAGHRTLLIDCDMRQPVQHRIFDLNGGSGLSSVLEGREKLRDVIHATEVSGLYVLPAGPIPRNSAQLLGGQRFEQIIEALGTAFERIIIDSPPLGPVTDGRILAATAHATLVVLRMNQSVRKASIAAIDALQKVGANILGIVANDVVLNQQFSHYYGSAQYKVPDRTRQLTAAANGNAVSRPGIDSRHQLPAEYLALNGQEDWAGNGD
jgi:succinoglycan biosynthesis transport protein ExoP